MDTGKDITIIMYHYVRDLKHSRYPEIKGLDKNLFIEQLNYLKKYYNFVSVEQIIEVNLEGKKLPPKAVLLTFDDAYIDHFTVVFPLLMQYGIKGAFYPPVKAVTKHTVLDVNKIHFILASIKDEDLPALLNEIKVLLDNYREEYALLSFEDYFNELAVANRFDCKEVVFVKRLLQVKLDEQLRRIMTDKLFQKIVGIDEAAFSRELYMSKDQIKCMIDCGMHIGSHGYDHYWLGSLSKEKQEFEIKESVKFIETVGGDINNWTICYPYGNYNEDTISLLKKYNCKLGLTTIVDIASLDESEDTILKLPRLDTNDIPKSGTAEPNDWYFKY
jgi:Predicted xylanase/chitin deacetylase